MPCPLEEIDMADSIAQLGFSKPKSRPVTTSNLGVLIRRHSSVAISEKSLHKLKDTTTQGSHQHLDPESN